MSSEREIRLLHRDLCGSDVGTFRFSRPEGYDYAAGQWMRITLNTAEGPDARTFSHASAPADDDLEIATRRSGSAFKEALWELDESVTVAMSGPGGRLALPPHARMAVFLAGGVGITPVRSILRDARQRGQKFEDIVVFYGNRDSECTPYLDELGAMGSIGVRVVPVYERDAPPGAAAGLISPELVERLVDARDGRPVLVTGPPLMVTAMESVLDELRVPRDARLIERFGPTPRLARTSGKE